MMILLSEPNNDMSLQTANETRTWKHKIASKERARVATTTNYNSTINEWAMMDLERGRGQCARLKDQTVTLLSPEGNALHACVCLVCVALLALSPCSGMMTTAHLTFSHASPFLPS